MINLRLAFVLAAIAGCSSPNPRPVAPPTRVIPIADTVETESGADLDAPQFCHLGRDCLALDSRPFTSCLVSGEPCEGKGEFLQAAPRVILESK